MDDSQNVFVVVVIIAARFSRPAVVVSFPKGHTAIVAHGGSQHELHSWTRQLSDGFFLLPGSRDADFERPHARSCGQNSRGRCRPPARRY
jgi:hypothetical protein